MADKGLTETAPITRRAALSGSFACAVACLIPDQMRGVAIQPVNHDGNWSGDLYAFAGVHPNSVVIAATWASRLHAKGPHPASSDVHIHAGTQRWHVKVPGGFSAPAIWEEDGHRIFAGSILPGDTASGPLLTAIIIEASTSAVSPDGLADIWAERFTPNGERQRFGSPFLTSLLAGNEGLAKLYHSTSPSQDRAILTSPLVEAISVIALKQGHTRNPVLHGRRLASVLLPDVLRYDVSRPIGFTFAAQNGRHPADASQVVVDTILNGAPSSASLSAHFRLQHQFPYFPRPCTSSEIIKKEV